MLFGSEKAKDFKHIEFWLNTPKPVHLEDFENKIIFLDFFAYSCINCRRGIPSVVKLYKKYHPQGLVVIGVHVPEFEFEKVPENLKMALAEEHIPYPVAMDNDHATWYLYGGEYWPRQVVIDQKGNVLLNVTGEGHLEEIEKTIRKALENIGADLATIPEEKEGKSSFHLRQTPEIYAGFFRNENIGSTYHEAEKCYQDPGEHEEGVLYPQGAWKQNYEYLWHYAFTKEYEYIALSFHGQETNIVAMPYNTDEKAKVYLEIDKKPIPPELAGKNVQYEGKQSYVLIDRPDLYRIFKTKKRDSYELKLITNSKEFCLLSYTFG